jgi:hypothetical protein
MEEGKGGVGYQTGVSRWDWGRGRSVWDGRVMWGVRACTDFER